LLIVNSSHLWLNLLLQGDSLTAILPKSRREQFFVQSAALDGLKFSLCGTCIGGGVTSASPKKILNFLNGAQTKSIQTFSIILPNLIHKSRKRNLM
jgi:hypothetical protein